MEELILKSIGQAVQAVLAISAIVIAFGLSFTYVKSWED